MPTFNFNFLEAIAGAWGMGGSTNTEMRIPPIRYLAGLIDKAQGYTSYDAKYTIIFI